MMRVKNKFSLTSLVLCGLLVCSSCAAQAPNPSTHRWTQFVQVEGQPEPVPAEWVATPEGRFAHSIKIPNPVPKDSGYRKGMTSEQYFEHLCKTEAGEFIYETVDNVEGFYFMRPPKRPTDDDLQERYKLEAPDIERMFQLYRATPGDRSTIFIIPGIRFYRYVEEKNPVNNQFERAFGFEPGTTRPKQVEQTPERKSRYGLIWRGVKRPSDRENIIAGNEWIVLDLMNNEVLAVFRNYARTGRVPNAPGGVWWLNAVQCPDAKPIVSAGYLGQQLYELIEAVLRPVKRDAK